jgi:hypothetical protein
MFSRRTATKAYSHLQRMPLLMVMTLCVAQLIACSTNGSTPKALSQDEKSLAVRASLDEGILGLARGYGDTLEQLESMDDNGELHPVEGISFQVPSTKALETTRTLQKELGPKGCLVFWLEMNFGIAPDKIGIMKGSDQFDIVKLRRTDGINLDIEHEKVVARLKEWDASYGLKIIGANQDWVQAEFLRQPTDMLAFAREVYEFCPDVVDQGVESVDALAREMKTTNTVYLWWD